MVDEQLLGQGESDAVGFSRVANLHFSVIGIAHALVHFRDVASQGSRAIEDEAAVRAVKLAKVVSAAFFRRALGRLKALRVHLRHGLGLLCLCLRHSGSLSWHPGHDKGWPGLDL
jgi:hypothetical protein